MREAAPEARRQLPMRAPPWRQRLAELDPPLWLLLALVAAPLALGAGGAAPPWPGGVAGLTSLAAVAAVVAAARVRQRHPGLAGPGNWRWAVPVLLVSALLYLLLLSRLSFAIPGTDEVGVKGLVCTAEARLVFTPECPGDDLEALRSAEYEATRIWQSWSVDLVRLALLGSWALAWAALCTLAAALTQPSFQALINRAPPATEADAGYFFISYAHADLAQLLPVLRALSQAGHPLWFDKGLEGASEWDSSLALKLRHSRAVVLFISPQSMASKWVLREVQYADNIGKPVFAVRIGDAALPEALAIRLPSSQVVEGSPSQILAQFQRVFAPEAGVPNASAQERP